MRRTGQHEQHMQRLRGQCAVFPELKQGQFAHNGKKKKWLGTRLRRQIATKSCRVF